MRFSRRWVLKHCSMFVALVSSRFANAGDPRKLASLILSDAELAQALKLARSLLSDGLSAGTRYPEVWIRDTNTFMILSLKVNGSKPLRDALINFLLLQGAQGDIVDGYVPVGRAQEPPYRTSPLLPGYQAHKNTVLTDQESSLVLAFAKYVKQTGDSEVLDELVEGISVRERLAAALRYPLRERFSVGHGLVWGGTTIDWGDVAPEVYPGTHLLPTTHRAVSVYNNALLASAIRDYLFLPGTNKVMADEWSVVLARLKDNIHKHLWDVAKRKYIPHLYLEGSPFPASFDEMRIYLHGGTAVAIEADLLNHGEVAHALQRMRADVRASRASSIGITVYPPYPKGFYANPILTEPYTYQNGGDWCWFGGRMVQQLIRFGMVDEAYVELKPMISRVVQTGKFYEWWTPDNRPKGSSDFHGSAGVLGLAIEMLYAWSEAQRVQIQAIGQSDRT